MDVADADISLLGLEEDTAHIRAALERVAKGERVDRSHLRQRGRNGEELVVSMALIPVRDDRGIVAACAVISDATERVHEAERRYRALVEALPLVTLISAPNDRSSVTYVSPQVEQMLGYSPTEWQDDPGLFGKLLHPDDKDEVLAGAKRKSSGAAPRKTEYRLLARSGGVVWVREEVATVRGPEGKPLYTQTLLVDIGERKRADEERERLLAAERDATALDRGTPTAPRLRPRGGPRAGLVDRLSERDSESRRVGRPRLLRLVRRRRGRGRKPPRAGRRRPGRASE